MSDKSPRQHMSKSTGKSVKEKRADKRTKTDQASFHDKLESKKK